MLKIRLRRMGAIRQPHYRIVVADSRAPRDGAFIELLGHYNPLTNPATIQVDVAKYEEWKKKGAQPTDAVASLVKQFNRANRVADVAPADKRTRTASGKRRTPAPATAPAAEVAETAETAQTAEAAGTAETSDSAEAAQSAQAAEAPAEAAEAPTEAAVAEAPTTEAPADSAEESDAVIAEAAENGTSANSGQ